MSPHAGCRQPVEKGVVDSHRLTIFHATLRGHGIDSGIAAYNKMSGKKVVWMSVLQEQLFRQLNDREAKAGDKLRQATRGEFAGKPSWARLGLPPASCGHLVVDFYFGRCSAVACSGTLGKQVSEQLELLRQLQPPLARWQRIRLSIERDGSGRPINRPPLFHDTVPGQSVPMQHGTPTMEHLPKSIPQIHPARQPALKWRHDWLLPELNVDVLCIRLADVVADAYVLPSDCFADFTVDVNALEFCESLHLYPPFGSNVPVTKSISTRLIGGALCGAVCMLTSIPDRNKLGEHADELLFKTVHNSLRTADKLRLHTVAMLPFGVHYGGFSPEDAARLTYRGVLAFCRARTLSNVSRLIVAVPTTGLREVFENALRDGFDGGRSSSKLAGSETQPSYVAPTEVPKVVVTFCGIPSDVLAAATTLLEQVMAEMERFLLLH